MVTIRKAKKSDAGQIAELFMLAWPVDEILKSNGISYGHLHEAMTVVAASEQTIYSYENTFVAEVGGEVVGAMCAYDGANYQRLKQPIVDVLGEDSGFAQLKETEAGEFYIDSVGVRPEHRGKGIASQLFEAQIARAAKLGHKVAGLIVDEDKPQAEALYTRLGFEYLDDKDFFGHRMKHMVRHISDLNFKSFGKKGAPVVMLIPGLGVSYEIFFPLIDQLQDRFQVVAMEVDGFVIGRHTKFTSVDNQAGKVIDYIRRHHGGQIWCAYGLSLGGKILSRVLERDEIKVEHSILDAAPLLPLPKWLVGPLRYLQAGNVWSCYHWTGFWRWVFRSHYFDILLDECRKVYPFGGARAVLDGYKSVYTNKLKHIPEGLDIHYWHGTLEAFVAKPQVEHMKKLCPGMKVEVFTKMNHGQMLIDHPHEVARRIVDFL